MSHQVNKSLEAILANIQGQQANIDSNLAAASAAVLGVEEDTQAAIDLLLARYGDVQVIGKIIGAQLAIAQLKTASYEVKVLEASIKAALDSEHFVSKITQAMSAQVIRDAATS